MRTVLKVSCCVAIAFLFLFSLERTAAGQESLISAYEFQRSVFAQLFQEGNYSQALEAMDPLLERYPNDPLLLRYRAMTLDRLGRSQEAIVQFQELLAEDPGHVPAHYFLGKVYESAGEMERATEEWWWVVRYGTMLPYIEWAERHLDRALSMQTLAPPREVGLLEEGPVSVMAPPRWILGGLAGWEWDSNVTLKPNDKALAEVGDKNAERFLLTLRGGYRLIRGAPWALDLLYTTRQSFHDDSFDDLNFISQEGGLEARRRVGWFAQGATLAGRYDVAAGFLEGDLFSWTNRLTFAADTRFTPHTRTLVSPRLAWIDFGPDGSNPPQTSRDGFYGDVGIAHYLYSDDFRSHLFLEQEYNDTRTQGGNFDRRGSTTRLGFHAPFFGSVEGDLLVGFRWNTYPRFTSLSSRDLQRRRDALWDFYLAFSRPLTSRLLGRLFYRFVLADNRNDFFEYDRHLSGFQLLF